MIVDQSNVMMDALCRKTLPRCIKYQFFPMVAEWNGILRSIDRDKVENCGVCVCVCVCVRVGTRVCWVDSRLYEQGEKEKRLRMTSDGRLFMQGTGSSGPTRAY